MGQNKGSLISERASGGQAAKAWLKSVAKQKEGKAEESNGKPFLNGKLLLWELLREQQWGANLWRCMKTGFPQQGCAMLFTG